MMKNEEASHWINFFLFHQRKKIAKQFFAQDFVFALFAERKGLFRTGVPSFPRKIILQRLG
ncbi:hypothetical protein COT07_03405 [Candidatus Woesearchaeota archaeon CG07_land_8_20_14_0_80_44_23]|nr:MAG: hypothetical protein COT07_03405 [Candidatus Woesearchaeota archaeon CG07_land_8_20_14_0_80_44_23]